MSNPTSSEKRPYMGKEDRRKSLLQAAANLVENKGWGVLTMSALAESAGVSRQLVYQHFPNLENLLGATAWTIFLATAEGTEQAIKAHPNDVRMAIRTASLVSLDMPKGQGDALWQLISGTTFNLPELEAIRVGIRELILKLWAAPIQNLKGMDDASSRTFAWMLIMAFWGMRQMVRDGLISRDEGVKEFDEMLNALLTRQPA